MCLRESLDDRLLIDDDEAGDIAEAERARLALFVHADLLRAKPRQVKKELRDGIFLARYMLRREHAIRLPVCLAELLTATEAPLQRVDALIAVGLDLEDDGAVALRFGDLLRGGAAAKPVVEAWLNTCLLYTSPSLRD